jgi:hypothetical protein
VGDRSGAIMTGVSIDPAVRLAAANNAAWCAAVCRTHGMVTENAADLWWSATRTPTLFPDCVTLMPGGAPELLLAIVDSSVGCSVKDSFADLDLAPSGLTVVHDAEWIVRESTAVPSGLAMRWRRVGSDAAFDGWEEAWRVAGDGPTNVLRRALLADPMVTVLAADADGEFFAGAIVNEAAGVLGLSNVFPAADPSEPGGGLDPWPSLVTYLVRHHRDRTIVGYEQGTDLDRAVASGFRRAGRLRVWMRLDD